MLYRPPILRHVGHSRILRLHKTPPLFNHQTNTCINSSDLLSEQTFLWLAWILNGMGLITSLAKFKRISENIAKSKLVLHILGKALQSPNWFVIKHCKVLEWTLNLKYTKSRTHDYFQNSTINRTSEIFVETLRRRTLRRKLDLIWASLKLCGRCRSQIQCNSCFFFMGPISPSLTNWKDSKHRSRSN